jgi:hypothetical protein
VFMRPVLERLLLCGGKNLCTARFGALYGTVNGSSRYWVIAFVIIKFRPLHNKFSSHGKFRSEFR